MTSTAGSYNGQFRDDKLWGYGVLEKIVSGHTNTYDGNWFEGEMQGKGKIINNSEGYTFEGFFVRGMKYGRGIQTFANGKVVRGMWKHDVYIPEEGFPIKQVEEIYTGKRNASGQKSGKGELRFTDGSIYTGQFYDNKMHGHGLFIKNEFIKYDGNFKFDKFNGNGIYHFDGGVYIGNFMNGIFAGTGKEYSANGDISIGQFSGNQLIEGKVYYASGEEYEGTLNNNELRRGKLKRNDGIIFEGDFIDGQYKLGKKKNNITYEINNNTNTTRKTILPEWILSPWFLEQWPKRWMG